MHSRDATVLIGLLWFNVLHYSSLFQYFFSIYYGPYSSLKFLIFLVYLYIRVSLGIVHLVELKEFSGPFDRQCYSMGRLGTQGGSL